MPNLHDLNQRAASPSVETIKELKKLNATMDKMLVLLKTIESNTRPPSSA